MEFIDREYELRVLKGIWDSVVRGKFNFIVVNGRRGVGKTRLLFEFANRYGIDMVYLFVEKKEIDILLNNFIARIEQMLNRELPKVRSIGDLLLLLEDISHEKPLLIVFDEFQNFMYNDSQIYARFQEFIDRLKFRKKARIMLVVIGSIVGMIRKLFENEASPLYGRKTSEIFLKPFEFWQIRSLLKSQGLEDEEEIIEIYSMLGGMPRYYDNLDRIGLEINKDNILEYFTSRIYPGWREVRNELIEEFREAHVTYFSILEAISVGKVSSNEIAAYTGILEKSIHKYLNELANYFEIIRKQRPALAPRNFRGVRYFIRDPFYRFWFRYIFPNSDLIEIGKEDALRKEIKKDLPNHVSFIFEDIVRKTILKVSGAEIKGIEIPMINAIGSWWDRKGNEIDLIGTWRRKIRIIGEIKWRNRPFDHKDLETFLKKIDLVNGKNALIIVVSKEGFTRSAKSYLEEKEGLALSLTDLSQIWDSITSHNKI